MQKHADTAGWVWVIIQDPDGDETLLGQHDPENGIRFIPAFPDRESAQTGLHTLVRDPTLKVEVQAIEIGEVIHQATGQGYQLLIMDQNGKVLKKHSR